MDFAVHELLEEERLCVRCREPVGPRGHWLNRDFCEQCTFNNHQAKKAALLLGGAEANNALVRAHQKEVAAYQRERMDAIVAEKMIAFGRLSKKPRRRRP